MPVRRMFFVLVTGVFALFSCHAGGSPAPSIHAADLHGPGSPIADGLVVPRHAQLLGRVFHGMTFYPYGSLSTSLGWVAVMTVSGDGQLSFNDLVSRARKIGYTDRLSDRPPRCGRNQGATVCSAVLSSPDTGEDLHVDSEVGKCGVQEPSHLVVTFDPERGQLPPPTRTIKGHRPPRTTTTTTTESDRSGHARTSPRLPGPGDLLNSPDVAPVRLEQGSRVVGPPMVSCDIHRSHDSVIEVTGPVEQVFNAYARQFADAATEVSVWKSTDHGVTIRTAAAGLDGGDSRVISIVEQPHHPTYGLVQTATDF